MKIKYKIKEPIYKTDDLHGKDVYIYTATKKEYERVCNILSNSSSFLCINKEKYRENMGLIIFKTGSYGSYFDIQDKILKIHSYQLG